MVGGHYNLRNSIRKVETTVLSGLVSQAEFESLAMTMEPHGFLLVIGVSFRVSHVEDKGETGQ